MLEEEQPEQYVTSRAQRACDRKASNVAEAQQNNLKTNFTMIEVL